MLKIISKGRIQLSRELFLQVLVAEKESRIAEMDAASSGEAARLRAALESVKGEVAHQKHEHVWDYELNIKNK